MKIAVGTAMPMHSLSDCGCNGQDDSGANCENPDASRFHCYSFKDFDLKNSEVLEFREAARLSMQIRTLFDGFGGKESVKWGKDL
jgi:hypothetical protein